MREIHTRDMQEIHTRDMCERYTQEICARDMHREICQRDMHEIYTREMCTREIHARQMCTREIDARNLCHLCCMSERLIPVCMCVCGAPVVLTGTPSACTCGTATPHALKHHQVLGYAYHDGNSSHRCGKSSAHCQRAGCPRCSVVFDTVGCSNADRRM